MLPSAGGAAAAAAAAGYGANSPVAASIASQRCEALS